MSRPAELREWLDQCIEDGWALWMKRLSANDTGLTRTHQAGILVPQRVLQEFFGYLVELTSRGEKNPRVEVGALILSHGERRRLRVIYYNNRVVAGGTRNEARITRWAGLLHPDLTGALAVFAVRPLGRPREMMVWIASGEHEEDVLEERFGPVEPETRPGAVILPGGRLRDIVRPAVEAGVPAPELLPARWRDGDCRRFDVTGEEIVDFVATLVPESTNVDALLLKRREREFAVFRLVENLLCLEEVRKGFATIDDFIALGLRIVNRRKTRSGRSLELQMRRILEEQGIPYSWNPVLPDGSRPDFIFPSAEHYGDPQWPAKRLRMLACKTTCKDRWRQILREARGRIRRRHLLTLQEGVSESQLREMRDAEVILVVPRALQRKYPPGWRERLVSVSDFLREVAELVR